MTVDKIRNVGIIAHGGAGKTSLVEAILYDTKQTTRIGKVEEGNTTTDFEPEEINHNISISSALASCQWRDIKINIIDTPGYSNFIEDTHLCLSAVDGVVILVSALSGVKAETNKVWNFADQYNIPRVVFVNKMNRDNADFYKALDSVKESYDLPALPLQIPLASGESFDGVVNLLTMKALRYNDGKAQEQDIPDDLKDRAEEYRQKLVELAVETDDALIEKYLEEGEVTDEEILRGIKKGALSHQFVPLICGSATKNIGVDQLLDTIILCLASPEEIAAINPIKGKNVRTGEEVEKKPSESESLTARVFKTIADPFAGRLSLFRVYSGSVKADSTAYNATKEERERIGQIYYLLGKEQIPVQKVGPGEIAAVAKLKDTTTGDTLTDESNPVVLDPLKTAEPMISYALAPKSRGDEEKVSSGLHKLLEEDPTLRFYRDEETKEMILSGMGQLHLEVTLEKLKRKFGVEVIMKTPKIPYRETIKTGSKSQGKYKKQSGGRGQYGDCWLEIEPKPRGGGFEFIDKIVGGAIPRQYIPAVEKGVVEALKEGVLASYPTVDLKVTVYDGSFHPVDSSEMAFKIAGSMGIKKAIQQAKPVLLEPIMHVEVIIPEEFLGNVIGDLNSRRGKVQGMESKGNTQTINALVPMSEMLTYANQLNSITSAQGMYSMEFSHYEEVPSHLTQRIIDERAALKQEKSE
jgi:elongation factor G